VRKILYAAATGAAAAIALASPALAAAPGYFTPNGTQVATDANCTQSAPPLPSDNCGAAGYEAAGRDFRFAQAIIDIPDHPGSKTADPAMYVALDHSSTNTWQYSRVGVAPCPAAGTAILVPGASPTTCPGTGSGWVAFAATAGAGAPPAVTTYSIAAADEGDGVLVKVFLSASGNSVQTTITLPGGSTYNNTFPVTGPTYTRAYALADWTTAMENGGSKPLPAIPSGKTRDTQFFNGRFTTTSGAKGTFNGPWKLYALEATSNGHLPPAGTLIGQPSYLWNDGHGYQGKGDDAFGVWRFPF
jgi:hypothetical protein